MHVRTHISLHDTVSDCTGRLIFSKYGSGEAYATLNSLYAVGTDGEPVPMLQSQLLEFCNVQQLCSPIFQTKRSTSPFSNKVTAVRYWVECS